jgi:hypothetical protein
MNNKVEKNPSIELSKLGDSDLSSPTPLKMYELIDHYSNIYEIPKHIAFNVAYLETRYKGPFDWKYKPGQTSYAGAVGPMQIMPATANYVHKQKISKKNLKNNIELNIRTFFVKVTDDRASTINAISSMFSVPAELIDTSPFALIGSVDACIEQLLERREKCGFIYTIVGAENIDECSPIVAALRGK